MKAGNIARYAAGFLLAYPVLGGASQARFSLKSVFDLQVNTLPLSIRSTSYCVIFNRDTAVVEEKTARASCQHLPGMSGLVYLPSWLICRFQRGLIDGVTTLELDNGITKVNFQSICIHFDLKR